MKQAQWGFKPMPKPRTAHRNDLFTSAGVMAGEETVTGGSCHRAALSGRRQKARLGPSFEAFHSGGCWEEQHVRKRSVRTLVGCTRPSAYRRSDSSVISAAYI